MTTIKNKFAALLVIAAVTAVGCSQSMVISKVDYSQSIESVLKPNESGMVSDMQHGLKFNIKPIQYAETQDTSSVTVKEVRYIRGQEGYYYITAPHFNHVYVMAPEKSTLKLKKKIAVTDSEQGLQQPAFNQRTSYIQLLNRETGDSWQLTVKGVQKEESQMAQREDK